MPAKKDKGNFSEDVYSYIEVNKAKKLSLYFTMIVTFSFMTGAIYLQIFKDRPWVLMGVSAFFIGLPLMFFPEHERWVYRPWQKSAQRVERHFLNDE